MDRALSCSDTIAALSTPPGHAGIGIIRISGPSALEIARKIFRPHRPDSRLASHRLHLGHLVDPCTGDRVDEVLLTYMKAPRSYTREDVVEINSHSGYTLLDRILGVVLDAGARQARPGEFTYRAFLNGRIDLTQAEAVMDLIKARSDRGLELAARQMQGALKHRVEELRESALEILAHVEVAIDYPDEDCGVTSGPRGAAWLRRALVEPLERICSAHTQRRVWVEGVSTAVVGRVNAGKSSLFNRLLEHERAIVTEVPGTTRDVIEMQLDIEGLPLRLMDTAGYRSPQDQVESLGISLSDQALAQADLALLVIDSTSPLSENDKALLGKAANRLVVVALNKIDLPGRLSLEDAKEALGAAPTVPVSALTGEGIPSLRRTIRETVLASGEPVADWGPAPNLRQHRALESACRHFRVAAEHMEKDAPLEITAVDLNSGLEALGEITGETAGDDVLDKIFSTFCLGK
ncbi:MAG: tRNA uridine-5-carboxymethylaminomethyl(34) synthesis GTPase MnmE [Desulfobacteraceae bacterium]